MLEKISSTLDKLAGLPYWQLTLLSLIAVVIVAGGYLVTRPQPRPETSFYSSEEAPPAEPGQLTVHVAGAVKNPGVVRLKEGERVINAVEGAGGPLPEADLESLNLAQLVQDGQRIFVRLKGEAAGGGVDASGQTYGSGKININQASAEELEELPGIGPTLAERIVAYREKRGGFRGLEELKQVSGIGEKKFAEIRDLIEI
jgi:competence protein ComEA